MPRIVSITCLLLLLACPIVCLAETAREFSAVDNDCGGVCEAMACGAVVEGAGVGMILPHDVPSPLEGLLSLDQFPSGRYSLRLATRRRGESAKRPSAAVRRQAVLQSFLF